MIRAGRSRQPGRAAKFLFMNFRTTSCGISITQPLLRGRQICDDCIGAVWRTSSRMVASAGRLRLGKHQSSIRISIRSSYEDRIGRVHRAPSEFCRDLQHLAVTLCRALNIPARYATGYLGDIGVPAADSPMDFSAWFEAYLEGRWWTFDARHNQPRIGRVLMATGRDASDVAMTTSFGMANLSHFTVVSEELPRGQASSA